MKISIESSGSFRRTESFLSRMSRGEIFRALEGYAREGVNALASSTPVESGATASAWNYEVYKTGRTFTISWTNSNVVSGLPIAILLQYGHGTGTGGYVQGRDYINPAMQPIFDKIAENVWKVVTSA